MCLCEGRQSMRGTVALLLLTVVASCGKNGSPDPSVPPRATGEDSAPVVYVVNYPLRYFTERIAGDRVDVRFPAPPDVDPAYWQPDEETIASYQQADLILRNGAAYAKWVEYTSLPTWKVVDTTAAFPDEHITIENAVTHTHGPEGGETHGGVAFTTWLDPALAIEQARAVKAAFVEAWPQYGEQFEAGFAALARDLRAIDEEMIQIVSARPDRPMLASHPVYQYLARRYDLDLECLHWEPDRAPTKAELQELEGILSTHPADVMIWESPPLAATVEALAQRGVRCVVFDPCGNAPWAGDYLETMRSNLSRLRAVY